jgi:hypothetical protein
LTPAASACSRTLPCPSALTVSTCRSGPRPGLAATDVHPEPVAHDVCPQRIRGRAREEQEGLAPPRRTLLSAPPALGYRVAMRLERPTSSCRSGS